MKYFSLEKGSKDNKSLNSCGLEAKELQNILYAPRAVNATLRETPKKNCVSKYVQQRLQSAFSFRRNIMKRIYLNINQLGALNFVMSLFHASICFEYMCSSSGGQNCIMQPL